MTTSTPSQSPPYDSVDKLFEQDPKSNLTAGADHLDQGDSLDSADEKDPPSFEDLISLQSEKSVPDSDDDEAEQNKAPEAEEARTITSGKASIVQVSKIDFQLAQLKAKKQQQKQKTKPKQKRQQSQQPIFKTEIPKKIENKISSAQLSQISSLLARQQVFEYRQVALALGPICQEFGFRFEIEQMPELSPQGESQTMQLKCAQHFKSIPVGGSKGVFEAENNNEEDLEMGSIFKRDLASLHCPVALKMQTTSSGFWQVKSAVADLTNLEHFPPLVHSSEKKAAPQKRQPVQELLLPINNSATQLQLESRQVLVEKAEKLDNILKFFSPQKPPDPLPQITLAKGTVRVATDFQVDICDSSNFMQSQQKTRLTGFQNVKFKKNTQARVTAIGNAQIEEQLFIEDDDQQIFKGLNYSTTQSDLHKLIRHLKNSLQPPESNMYKHFSGSPEAKNSEI